MVDKVPKPKRVTKADQIYQNSLFSKDQVKQFIHDGNLRLVEDVQSALKDLFGQALQAMLEGEMDHHLGYEKNGKSSPCNASIENEPTKSASNLLGSNNRRNGYGGKKVRSEYGDISLSVPRDREAEFEPEIVKKRQKTVTGIEDQILALYAKRMSTRDTHDHLEHLYGIEVSPTFISNFTDKVLLLIQVWQSRPLAPIYALVFLDAIHFKVRQDGRIISKAAYIMIGVDLDGMKDVLGIWIGEAESAKFWLSTLSEIQSRGTEDILICCTDNLTGFSEAIAAVYPSALIQKCIVHQVRNSLRYVSYKDAKAVVASMRAIYTSASQTLALVALGRFEQEWGKTYPLAVAPWRRNWAELSTFFGFAPELRKVMYTTNMIEGYNRQLRKVTKGKSVFPTDQSLLNMLFLVTRDVQRKWTMRIAHWGQILTQLSIVFEGRGKLND
ncbi:IS256 family transposase [Capsulimonas corticalis]|uniref:Mutator family transposase n=1 Tax=Capsulimonas corticalis TaxID=2219043 RepID=A0A402CWA0_9BACT|nr:IS256 family transposase [Capsulimonas corticalis]BDI34095.1 IS256 family transposase [Capsulimonas corticalis]